MARLRLVLIFPCRLSFYNIADTDVASETASEALDDLRGGKTNTPSQIRRVMSTAVPGTTYPTLSQIPQTSFSCDSVNQSGYYADPETGCQVYRQCLPDMPMFSYICPNKTLFNQVTLVCDWWYNVDCSKSAFYYSYSNPRLYQEHVLFLYDSAQNSTPSSNDSGNSFGILRSATAAVPQDQGTDDSTTESSSSESTDSSVTSETPNSDQSTDSSAASEVSSGDSSTDESTATTEADAGATTDQSIATTESDATTEADASATTEGDASATTEADATTDSGASTTEATESSTDSASGTDGHPQLDDSSTEVAPVTDETTVATEEASTEHTVNIGSELPTDFGANVTNVNVSADSALNPDIDATDGSLGDLSNTTMLIGLPNAHLEAAEGESTESSSLTEASESNSTTESSTEGGNVTTEASMSTSEAVSETSEATTDQSAAPTEATTDSAATSSESVTLEAAGISESTTVAEPEASTEQATTESGTADAGTTAMLSTVVAGLPEGALVFTVPTFRTSTAAPGLMRLGGRASRALIGFGAVSTEELPRAGLDRATTIYPTNQIQKLYAATAMEDEDGTTMEPMSSQQTADDSLSTTVQLPPALINVENASLSPQFRIDNMTGLAMAILSSRTNTSGSAGSSNITILPLFPLELLQNSTDSASHSIQSNSMILSNASFANASLDSANQTFSGNVTANLGAVTANPVNLDSDLENATQYTWTLPPMTTMLNRLETQGPGISVDRLLGRLPGFPTGSEPNFIGVSQNVSLITVDLLASNSTSGTGMSSSPPGFSSGTTNMLTSGSSTKALELTSRMDNLVTDPGSRETAATPTPSSSSSFFVTEVAARNFQAMLQQLYARLGNGAAGGKGTFVVAFVPGELSSNLTGTAG